MRNRTDSQGKSETYWDSESYTDWDRTAGQIWRSFADLILPACSPLAEKIPPWRLEQVTPYARDSAFGERPYSGAKISVLIGVLAVLAAAVVAVVLMR